MSTADPADFACTCGEPHYVYRCFDAEGRLLYIGVARNPEKRMLHHRRGNPEVALRTVKRTDALYPDRAHALAAEALAIATEGPLLNVRHNRRKSPRAAQKVRPSADELRAAVHSLGP